MKVQVKAFQWSFLIHTLLIGTVLALGTFFKNPPKMLVINFDLEPAPAQVSESKPARKSDSSKPLLQRKEVSPIAPAPPREKTLPKPPETQPKAALSEPQPQGTPFPSEQAVPVFSPALQPQSAAETNPGLPGGGNILAGGSAGGLGPPGAKVGGQGSGSGEDKAQSKYLREHFSYIRDKILRSIRYPAMARRMGWQGRVLLSFIVTLDGSIKEAKIVQGSGFEVLDKNAVETVQETAPFPKPPAEARLVIPITYRLEN
jgi:periplasmic protein TonB